MTDTGPPLSANRKRHGSASVFARRTFVGHDQQGLSLVELMVALLISTLIMIGLVQVFSASRLTYTVDEGLARLQENGRFAVDFLAHDIRTAGNMGCLGNIPPSKLSQMTTNYLNSTSSPFDLTRGGIEGFDAVGTTPGLNYTLPTLYPATNVSNTSPTLDTNLVSGAVKGSDVLVLRMMDSSSTNLVAPYNDSAQIFIGQPNSIYAGQVLVVTDCDRASVFQTTGVSNNSGTTNVAHATGTGGTSPGNICPNWGVSNCPGKTYKNGAQIAAFTTTVYYIGKSVNTATSYAGPSLFRRTWPSGSPVDVELVEGVENMQILYGVDSDHDEPPTSSVWHNVDRYVPASGIPTDPTTGQPDWAHVVSVRVGLLVSGRVSATATAQTNSLTDTATYSVDGVKLSLPASDTRERRVFTATIELRNRH